MAALSSSRIRLLPVTLFAAALLLTVKLGEVWKGLDHLTAPTLSVADAFARTASGPDTEADSRDADGGAGEKADGTDSEPSTSGEASVDDGTDAVETDDRGPDLSAAEINVLQQLAERRKMLDARAEEAEQRDALLRAAESRIEDKIDELRVLKAELESLIQVHDDQREAQIQSLVKIYENMKPKDAARIFEELDMDTLLLVADRMKERKLAPVMAQMNPRKAKDVTVELARLRELTEFSQPTGASDDG